MKKTFTYLVCLAFAISTQAQVNLQSGLIAHYALDGNANDSAANPVNGTVTGATPTTDRNGMASKAYSFSNATDKISVPISAKFNFTASDSFTFSVWAMPTQTTSTNSEILNIYKLGGIEIVMPGADNAANTGKLMVSNFDGINMVSKYATYSDSLLKLNQWQHILVTINSSNMKAYINGRLSQSVTSATFLFDSAGLTIGNHTSQSWGFKGSIDDVRIYNRIVNQSEINALAGITNTGVGNTPSVAAALQVYPNPSQSGKFILQSDQKLASVCVYDLQGKKITAAFDGNILDISTATPGLYLMQVQGINGESYTQKIIRAAN